MGLAMAVNSRGPIVFHVRRASAGAWLSRALIPTFSGEQVGCVGPYCGTESEGMSGWKGGGGPLPAPQCAPHSHS